MTLGDIEKISKLSSTLVIPMIAAAIYETFGLWLISFDSLLEWLSGAHNEYLNNAVNCLAFFVNVAIVAITYLAISTFLFTHRAFLYFFALSLLTYGFLGLSSGINSITTGGSFPSHLLFWQLAALCWGFDIFNTVEKITDIRTEG